MLSTALDVGIITGIYSGHFGRYLVLLIWVFAQAARYAELPYSM